MKVYRQPRIDDNDVVLDLFHSFFSFRYCYFLYTFAFLYENMNLLIYIGNLKSMHLTTQFYVM